MAYITKDSVQKCLDDLSGENLIGNENDTFISLAEAKDRIEELPTADVAPRAEVAREIFEEIEREITDALKSNYKVLPQVEESKALWNNVNGKINALRGIRYFIEELKKKYTESSRHEVRLEEMSGDDDIPFLGGAGKK